MSLNIKNPEAEQLATEVSQLAGESKTAAVIAALRERRARLLSLRESEEDSELIDDLEALAEQIHTRIGGTDLSTDHLYDPETGLPA
jgi:antitoxin VapB